jgi:Zn-dependent protease
MSSLSQILYKLSYMGLPLLFAMVLHEYAHGWMAERAGDSTARRQGRLTLNPVAHIDPVGTILLPLMCLLLPGGFFLGWAKPVPVDPSAFRNPRRDMALVAAAGPGMNLVLAILSAMLYAVLAHLLEGYRASPEDSDLQSALVVMLLVPIALMAQFSVIINVLLMLFNLIPIPPLDGGRILASLLPARQAWALARLEPYGMLIVMALILLDPQLGIIHSITGTLTHDVATRLMSTAVGLGNGAGE